MRTYEGEELVNVGCGSDVTIRELAEMVAAAVAYPGRIAFNTSKPDGTPRKLLDTSRATALGWKPSVSLRDGIAATYAWYRDTH
jgi:GDP-L-fucose synthase